MKLISLQKYYAIEKWLGIRFKKRRYLEIALTHASRSRCTKNYLQKNNELLEFLGDAVLELLTRVHLLKKYPNAHEGELSELKKLYTNTEALYKIGKALGLGRFLIMDKGEELIGGRDRPSNIAGGMEALIGALYLDRGLNYTQRFVNQKIFKGMKGKYKDHKSLLNRWAMKNRREISYRITKEEGPAHHKIFYIDLYVNGKKVSRGVGDSRKRAEQEAAKNFQQSLSADQ